MSTHSLEVDSTLGKFVLRQLLGEGGMGKVFVAEDTLLKRRVALKVMQPHLAKHVKARKRFLREAQSAAQVAHPRIVTVHEIGEIDEVPYIAMELLPGESLQDFLDKSPVPNLKYTLEVIRQIAEGLHVAHTSDPSLIHRDIKPANVWLKSSASNKKAINVIILDFGLARAAEGDEISNQSGGAIGTPHYMSPEQWKGREVDHRTDLYAIGVMLYQMTTGQLPFRGSQHQIMFQVTTEEAKPVAELNPNLPPDLVVLIQQLMARDKAQRIGSASEVIQQIKAILTTLPDEQTPFVGTSPNSGPERETRTPLPPKSARPTPTAVMVPHRSWLPLIGMLCFGLLLGAGLLLLLKGDPKPIEVVKTDDKLIQQMKEQNQNLLASNEALQKRFQQFQDEMSKKPLKTEEDLQRERKRETEMADLLKQLGENQTTLAAMQKQLKEKPKKTPEEIEQEKEQAARLQKLEDDRLKMQAELATQKAKNDELAKKLDDASKMEPKKEIVANLPKVEPKIPVPVVPKKRVEPEPLDCTKGLTAAAVQKVQKDWAEYLGAPVETSVGVGNGVEMKFVLIPPGKFMMGGNQYEIEKPIHEVKLTKPFYLGKYEVTQEEYTKLTGLANPSRFKDEPESKRHPVDTVSWNDAKVAWEALSKKKLPEKFKQASLPTEAQWEYACRAGTITAFHFGDVLNGDKANCDGENPFGTPTKGKYLKKTCPVDSKDYLPNAFGLHHMHGNVWEWCRDGWDEKAYKAEGRTDPETKQSDNRRCLRGGSWIYDAINCRSASRLRGVADDSSNYWGFRLALFPLD